MDQKEKRNKQILAMHNSGATTQAIATKFNLSKAGIHNIIKTMLLTDKEPEPIQAVKEAQIKPATTSNKGERVFNFGEYIRTGSNEYCHKSTGECIKVAFIPAKNINEFGYFVKV